MKSIGFLAKTQIVDLFRRSENKTFSDLVQENMNTLHSAREKAEASEELKMAMNHNINTC